MHFNWLALFATKMKIIQKGKNVYKSTRQLPTSIIELLQSCWNSLQVIACKFLLEMDGSALGWIVQVDGKATLKLKNILKQPFVFKTKNM